MWGAPQEVDSLDGARTLPCLTQIFLIESEEKGLGSQVRCTHYFVFHLFEKTHPVKKNYMINSASYKTKKMNYSSLSILLCMGKVQTTQTKTAE